LGQTLSQLEADGELHYACEKLLNQIKSFIEAAGLTQNQIDALISFAHNFGAEALLGSRLLEKIGQRDLQGAAEEFLLWNKPQVDGDVAALADMTARRQAERALFLSNAPAGKTVALTISNQERVVRGVGYWYASRMANVVAAYDSVEALVEIVEMQSATPSVLRGLLKTYPNLREFKFAAADGKIPEGARALFSGSPPPSPALEMPKLNRRLLVKGLRDSVGDSNISQMQSRLRDLGYFKGDATGYFGSLTDQAMMAFQADHFGPAAADGLVGPLTWAKLFGEAPPPRPLPAPTPTPSGGQAPGGAPVPGADHAPGAGTYLYLTRSGNRDPYGAEALNLTYVRNGQIVDNLFVCSGIPRKQIFRKGVDSPEASLEPLPEGEWSISDIGWCDGRDNYSGRIFNDGIGPAKIELGFQGPGRTSRSSIEMHIDWNRARSPGTAGCVGILNVADFKRLVSWLRDTDPRTLLVDWGLGTCPSP
jgi:lysozyme